MPEPEQQKQDDKELTALLRSLANLPKWLNWLLSVIEPLMVLLIAGGVVYAGYWLLFDQSGSKQNRLTCLMQVLNENWKVVALLMIVLFYRTIRIFLEQAEEAWGVKRKRPLAPEEVAETTNPPTQN
jgi:membrane-anchored glycerophosphoryl diester phosphodiesterase (GDPDase)